MGIGGGGTLPPDRERCEIGEMISRESPGDAPRIFWQLVPFLTFSPVSAVWEGVTAMIEQTIGFTGTQHGMNGYQMFTVKAILQDAWARGFRFFRHGDCIGSDEQAHEIAYGLGYMVTVHPPINPNKRAWMGFEDHMPFWTNPGIRILVLPAKDYIPRNHDIVDNSIEMIATPHESHEQLRSGTWATVRYARRCGKLKYLVLPN